MVVFELEGRLVSSYSPLQCLFSFVLFSFLPSVQLAFDLRWYFVVHNQRRSGPTLVVDVDLVVVVNE